mmetsp:Transcript_80011/g.259192  ORF Transcript_80011/g.259192 Transcript_80011/m.259192 type:complete len:135 (+) Transcript_80011:67-471(+)
MRPGCTAGAGAALGRWEFVALLCPRREPEWNMQRLARRTCRGPAISCFATSASASIQSAHGYTLESLQTVLARARCQCLPVQRPGCNGRDSSKMGRRAAQAARMLHSTAESRWAVSAGPAAAATRRHLAERQAR